MDFRHDATYRDPYQGQSFNENSHISLNNEVDWRQILRPKPLFCALVAVAVATPAGSAEPQVFSPGVVSSGAHDSAPAFSPNGNELFFGRSTPAASMILVSHRVQGAWSFPKVAPFSGQWLDMEPAMSPDGSYMIFVSNRPAVAGGAPIDGRLNGKSQPGKGGNLWRVDRMKGAWGRPVRLSNAINNGGSIYAPSIAADGTLYFMKPAATSHRFQLFSAKLSGQKYDEPQPLSFSDGSTTDVDPAVAPDQSFIIFGSGRRAQTDIDLFISHRVAAGWSVPIYLRESVNSRTSDAEPRLGPDGLTLYFSSERLAPVTEPIARLDSAKVANDMREWNNGLYNIWQTDLRPILAMPANAVTQAVALTIQTPDEAGVRLFEQHWSEAFVAGDARTLEDLLDGEYVSVNAKAETRTKQEVIAAAMRYAAGHPGEAATPLAANVIIKVVGMNAIVRHTGVTDRSVDILRYQDGRWIAVYSQHTSSPPTI